MGFLPMVGIYVSIGDLGGPDEEGSMLGLLRVATH